MNNEEDPLSFEPTRDDYPSSSEPKYTCHECEYSTSKRSNLMKHIVSKQDQNQMYPCDMCEYNGSTARDLKFHVKSKHEGRQYSCDKCGYVATNSNNLKLHIKNKHERRRIKESREEKREK